MLVTFSCAVLTMLDCVHGFPCGGSHWLDGPQLKVAMRVAAAGTTAALAMPRVPAAQVRLVHRRRAPKLCDAMCEAAVGGGCGAASACPGGADFRLLEVWRALEVLFRVRVVAVIAANAALHE